MNSCSELGHEKPDLNQVLRRNVRTVGLGEIFHGRRKAYLSIEDDWVLAVIGRVGVGVVEGRSHGLDSDEPQGAGQRVIMLCGDKTHLLTARSQTTVCTPRDTRGKGQQHRNCPEPLISDRVKHSRLLNIPTHFSPYPLCVVHQLPLGASAWQLCFLDHIQLLFWL